MPYLYRGVNENLYRKLSGALAPKMSGEEFASYIYFGQSGPGFGSGAGFGKSDVNAVILHQFEQAGIPTSGISSTPHYERARFYALCAGKSQKGYVFKLSVEQLCRENVTIYKVNHLVPFPAVPEDDEHILIASNFGNIPESAIVSIDEVELDVTSDTQNNKS